MLTRIFAIALAAACAFAPVAAWAQNSGGLLKGSGASDVLTYTVQKGDTLYDIAITHRVELPELMRVNNLTGSLIRPGDVLALPPKQKACLTGGNLPGGISQEK